jgi:Fic family protein
MEALGFPPQQEATLQALTEETVKSSEIEGEKLDVAQVRSSIARRLGMDVAGVDVVDGRVEGVVDMMLDATRNFDQPLAAERLFGWHASLFPTGRSGMRIGAQHAAVLQHVRANPTRAERLLRHPRALAKGHDGRDGLDGMVPRLPWTRYRWC